MYNFVKIRY